MKTRALITAGLLCFAMYVTPPEVTAKIKLPSVISDGMVLQQQSEVKLWGKADANSTVRISTSWNEKDYLTPSGDFYCRTITVRIST